MSKKNFTVLIIHKYQVSCLLLITNVICFNNAWIIWCYPISRRTQRTIASISKSITNSNPRLPAAKEEEEEEEEGRNGIFPPPQSPCCLHRKGESHISCPGWLCSNQNAADSEKNSIPKLGASTQLPRNKGSSWGCSPALLPCSGN